MLCTCVWMYVCIPSRCLVFFLTVLFCVYLFLSPSKGHEGPGSLLSYLKGKNWANSLGVAAATNTDDFTIFDVREIRGVHPACRCVPTPLTTAPLP